MQFNNQFDSTTVSEFSSPSANGAKDQEDSCTKYFHPYNLRCFLKITAEDLAKMDRFQRQVYEKQAENLVNHCDEEINFLNNTTGLLKKNEKDLAKLKAGIQSLDESIAANEAKIAEINALKTECTAERVACNGVQNDWDEAQAMFTGNITRIIDKLQKELDILEGKSQPMRIRRQDSRYMQSARDYAVKRQTERDSSQSNGRQNIRV